MKKRLINIVVIICIFLTSLSTISYASGGYIGTVLSGGENGAGSQIKGAGQIILDMALALGAAVAAVILVWLGIKYTSAAPDEKANIKKSAVAYLIGCVILFGFAGVIGFIVNLSETIGGQLG